MSKIRLDKLLSNTGFGSRKEVKSIIRAGRLRIGDEIIYDPGYIVDIDSSDVYVDNERISYRKYYYLMMNKPAGVISATFDPDSRTVLDLVPSTYRHVSLFPVGRLDKDTEGLLLFTNDGQLAHRLLSPKRHVPKTYYARIEGIVDHEDIDTFRAGIELEPGFTTLQARLEILGLSEDTGISEVSVTIYEGKYHQVKRMFKAVGKRVLYLKRISMGGLQLDESLPAGAVRELSQAELDILMND